MSHRVLDKREHVMVFARFNMEHLGWRQASLLQPRRIKVEPGHRPDDGSSVRSRETGGDTSDEQRRRSIVTQRRRCRCDLVDRMCRKAATGQSLVNRV